MNCINQENLQNQTNLQNQEKLVKSFNQYCGNGVINKNKAVESLKVLSKNGEKLATAILLFKESSICNSDKMYQLMEFCIKNIDKYTNNYKSIVYFIFGELHHYGIGTIQNFKKAHEYYLDSSELGCSNSLISLSSMYNKGQGVEINHKKAINILKHAIELENSTAMVKLGIMYQDGIGCVLDHEMAFNMFIRAAKMGNAKAMGSIGYMYECGLGRERDMRKSINFYKASLAYGDLNAMNNLGKLYYFGIGVPKNTETGIYMFETASKRNNINATYNLAKIYSCDVHSNYKTSVQLFEKCINMGLLDALHDLGIMYLKGKGVGKDPETAMKYLYESYNNKSNEKEIYNVVKTENICWNQKYYKFWPNRNALDSQISTILLISKFRCMSDNKNVQFFVKGICMIVVEYLCYISK